MDEQERLKGLIGTLQIVYGGLFALSLVMLGTNWLVLGHSTVGTAIWAVTLGSAVMTRLYRTSLVNRYNVLVAGGNAPLS
jgi:hypothetical protein